MAEARGSASANGVIGAVPFVQASKQRLQCERQIVDEVGEGERGLAGSALEKSLGRALQGLRIGIGESTSQELPA